MDSKYIINLEDYDESDYDDEWEDVTPQKLQITKYEFNNLMLPYTISDLDIYRRFTDLLNCLHNIPILKSGNDISGTLIEIVQAYRDCVTNKSYYECDSRQFVTLYTKLLDNVTQLLFGNTYSNFVKSIVNLDLSNNKLLTVSSSIYFLSHLRNLNLSHNDLEKFPLSLPIRSHLDDLEVLNLSHNNLLEITEDITFCVLLKLLNLSHNRISVIPENIRGLMVLENLDLSHNSISDTKYLTYINPKFVNLSHNDLRSIPRFFGLAQLEHLDISHNNITYELLRDDEVRRNQFAELVYGVISTQYGNDISDSEKHLNKIRIYNKYSLDYTDNPPSIDEILEKSESTVDDEKFKKLSDEIASLIPIKFYHLPIFPETLVTLDMSYNSLEKTPNLSGLKYLESINLSHNLYTKLSIPRLDSLQQLNAEHNSITVFPLVNAQVLNCRHNSITGIGDDVNKLHKLEHLNISYNPIKFVSKNLLSLLNLKTVDWKGTPDKIDRWFSENIVRSGSFNSKDKTPKFTFVFGCDCDKVRNFVDFQKGKKIFYDSKNFKKLLGNQYKKSGHVTVFKNFEVRTDDWNYFVEYTIKSYPTEIVIFDRPFSSEISTVEYYKKMGVKPEELTNILLNNQSVFYYCMKYGVHMRVYDINEM